MGADFRIVNVIASTRVMGQIDIEELSLILRKSQYEPGNFPGLVYRRSDQPTIIMFASGKISSHGAKSELQAKNAILRTLEEIAELGCIIGSSKMMDIRIENVVGVANLHCPIDLESVSQRLQTAVYEPEWFPGMYYRPFHNSLVCIIFTSGKIVLVGGKSERNVKQAFEKIKKILQIWCL